LGKKARDLLPHPRLISRVGITLHQAEAHDHGCSIILVIITL
jgi:hypothetical protein